MTVVPPFITAKREIINNFNKDLSLIGERITNGIINRDEYQVEFHQRLDVMSDNMVQLFLILTWEEKLDFYRISSKEIQSLIFNLMDEVQQTACKLMQ